MLRHYFVTSTRFLLHHKLISFICILGLALAFGSSIPFFHIIKHELTFDNFHKHPDQIYRIYIEKENGTKTGSIHVPAVEALRDDFPEFELISAVKVAENGKIFVNRSDGSREVFKEDAVFFVDENFLKIFNFSPVTSFDSGLLVQPNQALITPRLARKYFGTTDVVGKYLTYNENTELYIAGLIKEPPGNSDFQYNLVISFSTYLRLNPGKINDWLWFDNYSFAKLKKGDRIENYRQRLEDFTASHAAFYRPNSYYYRLQPLREVHTDTSYEFFDAFYHTPPELLWIPGFLALIILTIASANFVNLSVAFSLGLVRESCIRKIIGSTKIQLILRLFLQNMLLITISIAAGICMAIFLLEEVNKLFGIVQYNLGLELSSLIFVLLVGFLILILSTFYPTLILANSPLENVLRSFSGTSGKTFSTARKSLVIFQICASLVLLLTAIVVGKQIEDWKSTDFLYRNENIYTFSLPKEKVKEKQALRAALLQLTGVQYVSFSTGSPSSGGFSSVILPGTDKSVNAGIVSIDESFLDLYDLKLVSGSISLQDSFPSILINKKLATLLGFNAPEEALGVPLKAQWLSSSKFGIITGILPDFFNGEAVNKKIDPQAMIYAPRETSRANVAVVPGGSPEIIHSIERICKEIFPDEYFRVLTLKSEMELSYLLELLMQKAVRLISIIAIIISCIGILGIVSYIGVKRRKEFSIRKVFGAGFLDITAIFFLEFNYMLITGFILGSAAGYYLLAGWLANYSNHILLKPAFFLESMAIITLLFILSMQYQILKTSGENPARVLKDN